MKIVCSVERVENESSITLREAFRRGWGEEYSHLIPDKVYGAVISLAGNRMTIVVDVVYTGGVLYEVSLDDVWLWWNFGASSETIEVQFDRAVWSDRGVMGFVCENEDTIKKVTGYDLIVGCDFWTDGEVEEFGDKGTNIVLIGNMITHTYPTTLIIKMPSEENLFSGDIVTEDLSYLFADRSFLFSGKALLVGTSYYSMGSQNDITDGYVLVNNLLMCKGDVANSNLSYIALKDVASGLSIEEGRVSGVIVGSAIVPAGGKVYLKDIIKYPNGWRKITGNRVVVGNVTYNSILGANGVVCDLDYVSNGGTVGEEVYIAITGVSDIDYGFDRVVLCEGIASNSVRYYVPLLKIDRDMVVDITLERISGSGVLNIYGFEPIKNADGSIKHVQKILLHSIGVDNNTQTVSNVKGFFGIYRGLLIEVLPASSSSVSYKVKRV